MLPKASLSRQVVVGVSLLLIVPLVFAIWSRAHTSSADITSTRSLAGAVAGTGSIIANGKRVTLAQAIKRAPFRIVRPNDPLASDGALAATWLSFHPPQVGLQYKSGIRIYVRPSELGDPTSFYKVMIRQGAPGSIEKLGGLVAFVIPQNPSKGTPGSVDIVVDRLEVAIIGGGNFSVADLKRVAESAVPT